MPGLNGHSNRRDFPYFRIDSAGMALVAAIGWSGQWRADVSYGMKSLALRLTAGQETTHFKLHPGERVRTPRILLLSWPGDPGESNSQFRRLLMKHYIPPARTAAAAGPYYEHLLRARRGGGWLNECNAANQIALIRALRPLGVEAVITDAGWFAAAGRPGPAIGPPTRPSIRRAWRRWPRPPRSAARSTACGSSPSGRWPARSVYREHPEWLLTNAQQSGAAW